MGRMALVSHSGIASASQPGTTASRRRAVPSCRLVMAFSYPVTCDSTGQGVVQVGKYHLGADELRAGPLAGPKPVTWRA
jgi:hypothetical protein